MLTTRCPLPFLNSTEEVLSGRSGLNSSFGLFCAIIILFGANLSRLYMFDGLYQSLICFFLPYLLFAPGTFNTEGGLGVNDNKRFGVYIANATVVVVNVYILLNTYRWDWFMVLITSISFLLIFLWTGVYTSFTSSYTFYEAGSQVYGSLSFWTLTLLTIIVSLLPRFMIKSFQKIFMPRDIDIIREQIRQGKFDYLKNDEDAHNAVPTHHEKILDSASGSEISKPSDPRKISTNVMSQDDDRRPMYPPSVTNTATTYHPYSPNGSDGSGYTAYRNSVERAFPHAPMHTRTQPSTDAGISNPFASNESARQSFDRPRPSFDRLRNSMEHSRTRASFEASQDFTSAAYLTRVESAHSRGHTGMRNEL